MFASLKNTKLPKKRYIALGILAFELASLPAAAHIVMQSLPTEAPAQTHAVLVDETETQQRFVVTSNIAFHVTASDFRGDVKVSLHKSGQIGASRFGDNAQMPGAALSCMSVNELNTLVYQSKRKITIEDGEPLSQAILVVVDYEEKLMTETAPSIEFVSGIVETSQSQPQSNCIEQMSGIKGA